MSNDNSSHPINLRDFKTYHVGALESAAHRSMRQYKDALLSTYGISGMEWYVIGAVADAGPEGKRITELAKLLGTTMGFLTKTVNILEIKGAVRRVANAKDARSNYIVLDESYLKTCNEIEEQLRIELRKAVYDKLTPQELATYIKVLETFTKLP